MSFNVTTTLFSNFTSTPTYISTVSITPNTSNVTGETGGVQLGDRDWFKILKYTLYAIIFLISLVGNIVVCYVVSRRMKLKTVTNYFIMNLALADLVYTLCIPLDIFTTKSWPYGSFMCRILWPAQTLTITVSGFTLTTLSVTRFWAVVNPLRRQISVKQSFVVILLLWLCATSTVLPYIIRLKFYKNDGVCGEEWPSHNQRQTYTASLFVIQYAVPLSIITTCYVRIGLELMKGPNTYNKTLAKARGRESKKVIKMLIVVTLIFAILTLPSAIMWMWLDFGQADKKLASFWDIMDVLNMLDFLNCATNPIIYSFCNESFSREFRRQLGCILPSPPPSDSERPTTFLPVGSSSPSRNQMSERKDKDSQSCPTSEDGATLL